MRILISMFLLLSVSARAAELPEANFPAAEALLRHIVTVPPLSDGKFPICVTIDGVQAPSNFIERLKNTRLQFVACGNSNLVTRIPISGPGRKPDANGDYQVTFGYYVDSDTVVQGKMMFAYMRQDWQGWHVSHIRGGVSF